MGAAHLRAALVVAAAACAIACGGERASTETAAFTPAVAPHGSSSAASVEPVASSAPVASSIAGPVDSSIDVASSTSATPPASAAPSARAPAPVAPPDAGTSARLTSASPRRAACPATLAELPDGAACADGTSCTYGATRCACALRARCSGVAPRPDEPPPVARWQCTEPRTDGCPNVQPALGSRCTGPSAGCAYGSCSKVVFECVGGAWAQTRSIAGPPRAPPRP